MTSTPPPSPLHAAFDTIVRSQYEITQCGDTRAWLLHPPGRPDRLLTSSSDRAGALYYMEHLIAAKVAPLLSAVEILGRVGYTAIPKG